MSGGCHQARHRARSGEVAGGEYRIRQKLAEHHPKERIPCGCQGFRGDGRQVREIFLPKSWGRRLGATVFDPVSSRKQRSEERRVGKECRARRWPPPETKKATYTTCCSTLTTTH